MDHGLDELDRELAAARGSDWVIVCSGIGANDDYIQEAALALGGDGGPRVAFWDVDAPFNLQEAFALPTAASPGASPPGTASSPMAADPG